MDNIWKTPEAEAWSRGFGYNDYTQLCKTMNVNPESVLPNRNYFMVCDFLNIVMERSIGVYQSNVFEIPQRLMGDFDGEEVQRPNKP